MTTHPGNGAAKQTPAEIAWRELREAAVAAAWRGWPVVPGVVRTGEGGCTEVRPATENWHTTPVTDPDQAWTIWDQHPYAVLLVCGRGVDVLEIPFRMAELLPALAGAGLAVPVATVPAPPRWLLFAATGSGTLREDLATASVRLRGEGRWVALPPTRPVGHAPIRWHVPPTNDCDTPLPSADEVQQVLIDTLHSN